MILSRYPSGILSTRYMAMTISTWIAKSTAFLYERKLVSIRKAQFYFLFIFIELGFLLCQHGFFF